MKKLLISTIAALAILTGATVMPETSNASMNCAVGSSHYHEHHFWVEGHHAHSQLLSGTLHWYYSADYQGRYYLGSVFCGV